MKPFNLEEAKAGNIICTRNGNSARIVDFNFKKKDFPIVAIVSVGNIEKICTYTSNGSYYEDKESDEDLMMVPIRREGWVNVYITRNKNDFFETPMIKEEAFCGPVYETKESAIEYYKNVKLYLDGTVDYVDTIKIEWEE